MPSNFRTFTARVKKHEGQFVGAISRTGVRSGDAIMFARPAPWGPTITDAVAKIFSCDLMEPAPEISTTLNSGKFSFSASRTWRRDGNQQAVALSTRFLSEG